MGNSEGQGTHLTHWEMEWIDFSLCALVPLLPTSLLPSSGYSIEPPTTTEGTNSLSFIYLFLFNNSPTFQPSNEPTTTHQRREWDKLRIRGRRRTYTQINFNSFHLAPERKTAKTRTKKQNLALTLFTPLFLPHVPLASPVYPPMNGSLSSFPLFLTFLFHLLVRSTGTYSCRPLCATSQQMQQIQQPRSTAGYTNLELRIALVPNSISAIDFQEPGPPLSDE